jgi:hypothetical protein
MTDREDGIGVGAGFWAMGFLFVWFALAFMLWWPLLSYSFRYWF